MRPLLTALVLLLAGCLASAAAELTPALETIRCPFDKPRSLTSVECRRLTVPEDAAKPEGRQVRLFILTVPASRRPKKPDPIVIFHGGPGAAGSIELLVGAKAGRLKVIDPQRDLILVDQRGSGLSELFLGCGAAEPLKACHARLTSDDMDLSQYRSARIADDLRVLRQALKLRQWNLYGGSYGPVPLQLYLDGDRAAVRRVILDSASGPEGDIARRDVINQLNQLDRLAEACDRQPDCARLAPGLAETLRRLIPALNRRPLPLEAGDTLTGTEFIRLLVGQQQDDPRILPAAIAAVSRRDPAALDAALAAADTSLGEAFLSLPRRLQDRFFATGARLAVYCADLAGTRYGQGPLRTRKPWPAGFQALLEPDYLQECRTGDFPVPPSPAAERRRIVSDMPALLLAGSLDPVNPPEELRFAAAGFARTQLLVVPGATHVVLGKVPCAEDVLRRFLDSPDGRVDGRCLTQRQTPGFFIP